MKFFLEYLIRQKDACVASCSQGFREKEEKRICVECEGSCPKSTMFPPFLVHCNYRVDVIIISS